MSGLSGNLWDGMYIKLNQHFFVVGVGVVLVFCLF